MNKITNLQITELKEKLKLLNTKWAEKYKGIKISNFSFYEIKVSFQNDQICISENYTCIDKWGPNTLCEVIKSLPELEKKLEEMLNEKEYSNANKILDDLLSR